MKNIPEELIAALSAPTIEYLQDIVQLHVCASPNDATSAINGGAVLLGISRVDNDEDWDGFRFLIGLPRNVKVTPHLSSFFHER